MKAEKCRVLVVDDQETIRFFIKKVARLLHLQLVGEAEDGEQAVELYRNEAPDLVLLDINMPLKRGDEALREILAIDPKAQVVMLTSVAEMDIVKKCIEGGAVNYILKNTPLEKMKEMLRNTIEAIPESY